LIIIIIVVITRDSHSHGPVIIGRHLATIRPYRRVSGHSLFRSIAVLRDDR